jgi:hypothetical protein
LSEEQVRFWVRDEIRKILDKGLMYSAEVKPKPQPQTKPEKMTATQIVEKFPEDLRKLITVEDNKIRKKFVSPETFKVMDDVAKSLGYKWVSDGKNSRWEK